ncbi:MAG: hypothetical protein WBH20_14905 [Oceanisphaera sp.]|uniref:hypothetical protein n=1 Tax=Oceanisphaera sp. TaxID=1929979 RepID=UPI003C71C93E
MSSLTQLTELDIQLFAELAKADEFDEDYFSVQLTARANLLAKVISEGSISTAESSELIARSRQLKEAAEQLQHQLGEHLKQMNKGRRSVKAYQTVKRN